MKIVKGLMDSMMPVMMKGLTPEEKEQMMLKMMPMMMEDIDLAELMPKMMTAMLPELLPQLFEFLTREGSHENLLDLFATVMPNVCEVIDKPKLAEKKDVLLGELMSHETFREKMPQCFTAGFPIMFKGFVEHFYPAITGDQRDRFVIDMVSILIKDLPENDKKRLLSEAREPQLIEGTLEEKHFK